ncbi:MAG: right-handed parallel beta-helix repeat-containing protein [Terrimicrobiaceae bacterium]
MKNPLARIVRLLCLAAGLTSAPAGQIWVSPVGNDADPGTRSQPLATPERARDMARQQISSGQKVEIILLGGTYELKQPLELTAEDSGTPQSPVVWRAAKGAEVRLSAGRTITGWQAVADTGVLAQLDPIARDRVSEIDLKALGITEYGEMTGGFAKNGTPGIELFVDDKPMRISRYPNDGFIPITEASGPTGLDVRGTIGAKEGILRVEDPRIARWVNEKNPMAMGYWFWDWADERQKITTIDPSTLTVTLAPPWHTFGYRRGQYFFGFNLLCEIDQPGEWFLDHETGKLYACLPETASPARTMVSSAPSVLKLKGCSHWIMQDLILEGARENAVVMTGCENIELQGCMVRNSGKWAVRIDGGHRCAIRGCDISGTGDGGVNLQGGDRATLVPGGHVVEDCRIHSFSRWDRTYQPGISLNGVGCRASNNLIHDAPHQAMNLSGNDHVIEYNEIHNVCEETNDAGAIYGWNDWAARGNVIRFNYLHDIQGLHAEGANGIYLDDNFSSATIEGNIFRKVVRAIHLGGGRDHQVINNLFVDCPKALHIDARGLGWRAFGFEELKEKLELWPYRDEPWSARYPQLPGLLSDEPMAPKGILVARNILIDCPSWDDIENKARPFLTMTENLPDAPRTLLTGSSEIPCINEVAPEVRKIRFEAIPIQKIGLPSK